MGSTDGDASFDGLPAERGGPADRRLRWFAHVIRPDKLRPDHWSRAYGHGDDELADVVAAFPAKEYRARGKRVSSSIDRLIEFVPVDVDAPLLELQDVDPSRSYVREVGEYTTLTLQAKFAARPALRRDSPSMPISSPWLWSTAWSTRSRHHARSYRASGSPDRPKPMDDGAFGITLGNYRDDAGSGAVGCRDHV